MAHCGSPRWAEAFPITNRERFILIRFTMVFLPTTSSRCIETRAVCYGREPGTERSRALRGEGSRRSLLGFRTAASLPGLLRQRTNHYGSRHLGMECFGSETGCSLRSRFATAFRTLA